jgi:hypothetical protein
MNRADDRDRSIARDTSGAARDASGGTRDTSGGTRDTSGAHFEPFPTPAEHVRLAAVHAKNPRVSAGILNTHAAEGAAAARRKLRSAKGPPVLLDRAPSPPSPQATQEGAEAEGDAASYALGWHLSATLHACRGGPLTLFSVSLSAPAGVDVRGPAVALATGVAGRPGEGIVQSVDRRKSTGAEHLYGPALVHDIDALSAHWRALTGAGPRGVKYTPVTGWGDHQRGDSGRLKKEVPGVLNYAFEPWPVQHGRRNLATDVFAGGVFVGPWAAALAAVAPWLLAADPRARRCQSCNRPLPPGKAKQARCCGKPCRQKASRDRKRARR